jgi:hypothetical protein
MQMQPVQLTVEDWNKVVNILAKEPYTEVFTIINTVLTQLAASQQEEGVQPDLKEVKE